MRCNHCLEYFECKPYSNPSWFILCPNCCRIVSSMSEYGFGRVYPVGFYLGSRKIAEVVQQGNYPNFTYVLQRYGEKDLILKNEKYPQMMNTVNEIIYKWLIVK